MKPPAQADGLTLTALILDHIRNVCESQSWYGLPRAFATKHLNSLRLSESFQSSTTVLQLWCHSGKWIGNRTRASVSGSRRHNSIFNLVNISICTALRLRICQVRSIKENADACTAGGGRSRLGPAAANEARTFDADPVEWTGIRHDDGETEEDPDDDYIIFRVTCCSSLF